MNKDDQDLDRQLRELLEPLRNVPPRQPSNANAGRNRYLNQVNELVSGAPAVPVSATPFLRLNGWKQSITNPLIRKERFKMLSVMTVLVVVFTMVFGGAGATVYAAQQSLPDAVLYPVKMMSETVWTSLARSSPDQVNLLLRLADRRVDEVAGLLSRGDPVPEGVLSRYQGTLENIFQLTSAMGEDEMLKTLNQVRLHLRNQERVLGIAQVSSGASDPAALARIQTTLREQMRRVETGIENPLHLRQQFQLRFNQGVVTPTITASVTATITATVPVSGTNGLQYGPGLQVGPGPGAGPGPDAGPGPQVSPNPDVTPGPKSTPQPGPGSDPGTKPTNDANPDKGPGSPGSDPSSAPDASGGSTNSPGNTSPSSPSQPSSGSGGNGKP